MLEDWFSFLFPYLLGMVIMAVIFSTALWYSHLDHVFSFSPLVDSKNTSSPMDIRGGSSLFLLGPIAVLALSSVAYRRFS